MTKNSKNFDCITTFYISILILIVAIGYLVFKYDPILFKRVATLWPIGILILSTILQYLYFERKAWILLPLSGFLFVSGVMFTINLHNPYLTQKTLFSILLLGLAAGLLNYYIFYRGNDLLLPFIFILILGGILIFLLPIYINYLSFSQSSLSLITLVIFIICYIVIGAFKK